MMGNTLFHGPMNIATSITEAIRATNPQFHTHAPAFTENCQRCVSAYEARRRGYDVVAKPRILNGIDSLPYMDSGKGWPAVYQNYKLESCAASTSEQARVKVETLMKAYGDGSRAIVKVNWRSRYKGHVFIAENQEQTICFLDPQTGSIDVSWYFYYADPASVVIMRIDQLYFTELIEQCLDTPQSYQTHISKLGGKSFIRSEP